jgi:hypothetical protein
MYDLDHVSVGEDDGRVLRAPNDLAIALDRDRAGLELQRVEQTANRETVWDVARLSVHRELHRFLASA